MATRGQMARKTRRRSRPGQQLRFVDIDALPDRQVILLGAANLHVSRVAVLHRTVPCVSAEVRIRIVSELCHIPPETRGQHRDLRGCTNAHRCCGKSLIGSALLRFGVRQHA